MIRFVAQQWKNPNFYVMLVSDGIFFVAALVLAYLLRFEFELSSSNLAQIEYLLVPLVCLKLSTFLLFGLYRGKWRYTSLKDIWRLGEACAFATLVFVTWIAFVHHFAGFSRAVVLLDFIFTFILTAGFRVMIRYACGVTQSRDLGTSFAIFAG